MSKLFKNKNNVFCELESCKKKHKCIRWVGHYPKWDNLATLYIKKEDECVLYSSISMITYLDDILAGRIK